MFDTYTTPDSRGLIFQLLFSHYADFIRETGRTHVLTPSSEGGMIRTSLDALKRFELEPKFIPIDERGQVTRRNLQEHIRPRSGLLTFSLAHPMTGVIQPANDLIEEARASDMLIHIDVTAAVGKLSLSALDLQPDFITNGSTLLTRRETLYPTLKKLLGLEPSSAPPFEDNETIALEIAPQMHALADAVSELGGTLHFTDVDRLPDRIVASFPGIHGELLAHHIGQSGPDLIRAVPIDNPYTAISLPRSTDLDLLKSTISKLQTFYAHEKSQV